MTKDISDKEYRALQKVIVRAVQKSYLEELLLTNPAAIEGKSKSEIQKMVAEYLYDLANDPKLEVSITIDHTKDLLKSARFNLKKERTELAAFFYATYFEHKINHFIHLCGKKRKLSEACIKSILQKLNLDDKSTWGLEILGIKPIIPSHKKVISEISNIRNQYVHFKWKPENEDSDKQHRIILAKAEKTVRYLRQFEERVVFNNSRQKALKSISK